MVSKTIPIFCFRNPSSHVPTTVDAYRMRYNFVLKFHRGNRWTATARSLGGNTFSNCPWQWKINFDARRMPQVIPYADCQSCNKTLCQPVRFYHKALFPKCDHQTGESAWKWEDVVLNVAFISVGRQWLWIYISLNYFLAFIRIIVLITVYQFEL